MSRPPVTHESVQIHAASYGGRTYDNVHELRPAPAKVEIEPQGQGNFPPVVSPTLQRFLDLIARTDQDATERASQNPNAARHLHTCLEAGTDGDVTGVVHFARSPEGNLVVTAFGARGSTAVTATPDDVSQLILALGEAFLPTETLTTA